MVQPIPLFTQLAFLNYAIPVNLPHKNTAKLTFKLPQFLLQQPNIKLRFKLLITLNSMINSRSGNLIEYVREVRQMGFYSFLSNTLTKVFPRIVKAILVLVEIPELYWKCQVYSR